MMCSSSSSLLNGMLIFPLPLAEQVNCTLVLRNLESFSLSMVNSSGTCENVMEMALVENIQRQDLNAIEIALAYELEIHFLNFCFGLIGRKRS